MNVSPPAPTTSPRSRLGFTLVELLVVIAILIVLAALGFKGASQALRTAKMSRNMANMRDLGTVLSTYAAEYGHFPPGTDTTYTRGPLDRDGVPMGGRAPDIVNAYREMWSINETWLSPVVRARLSPVGDNYQPTHYSGHPVLMYDETYQDGPVSSQVVSRPGETFLICDGVPINPNAEKDHDSNKDANPTMVQWFDYSDRERLEAEHPIPTIPAGTPNRAGPDFRNNDRCHVLFVDGSISAFSPDDFKVKHITLAY